MDIYFFEQILRLVVFLSIVGYVLDEESSDRCISALMGSPGFVRCTIPTECIVAMSRRGLTEYGITHQLLYSMQAELVSGND